MSDLKSFIETRYGEDIVVTPKIQKALQARVMAHARMNCMPLLDTYAICTQDKMISVIWQCRKELNTLNECLHKYSTSEQFETFKTQWINKQRSKLNRANISHE